MSARSEGPATSGASRGTEWCRRAACRHPASEAGTPAPERAGSCPRGARGQAGASSWELGPPNHIRAQTGWGMGPGDRVGLRRATWQRIPLTGQAALGRRACLSEPQVPHLGGRKYVGAQESGPAQCWAPGRGSVNKCCCSVVSESLRPHGLQHARAPRPSPTPGVCSNSRPLSQRCHPTISSSIIPFSCLQSFQHQGLFL